MCNKWYKQNVLGSRYRRLGPLGVGGIGEVSRVWDGALEQEVALKRVPFGDPASMDAFARELGGLGQLAHPHLLRLLDLGLWSDGAGEYGYYTADLLDASPLGEWSVSRSWGEIVAVLWGPIGALSALHSAGWMHGDISAANVLVSPDGHATLIDLSCARPLGTPLHTLDGTHPAPEILKGAEASVAVDLYALGRTLAGLSTLVSHAPPRAVRALIEQLVQESPSARPDDAIEVLERLGGEPMLTRATGSRLVGREAEMAVFEGALRDVTEGRHDPRVLLLRGPRGVGRSRLLDEWKWRAARVADVDDAAGPRPGAIERLLARGGAADLPGWLDARAASDRPTVWFADDLDRASEAESARWWRLARAVEPHHRVLLVAVGEAAPDGVSRRDVEVGPLDRAAVSRWVGARATAEGLDALYEATGGVAADVRDALLGHHVPSHPGWLDAFEPVLRDALVRFSCGGHPSGAALDRLRAEGWVTLEGGTVRWSRPGDAERVRAACTDEERAETHLALANGSEGPERVAHLARAGHADAHRAFVELVRDGSSAHELVDAARALAPEHPSLHVADVLEAAGRASEALTVLAALRRGADPPTIASLRWRAGRCRLALGDPAAAARHLRRAHADAGLRERVALSLSQAQLRRGDYADALSTLEDAPRDDPHASAHRGVALSYLGRHDEAETQFARAARGELDPRARLRVVSFRAISHYRQGHLAEAADGYRRAYRIAREHRFEEQLPQVSLNLATIEHRVGDPGAARQRYEEALTWARALGRRSTEVTLRLNRARLHAELGAFSRALPELERARQQAEDADLPFLRAESYAIEAELAWMRGTARTEASGPGASGIEASGLEASLQALEGFTAVQAGREANDTRVLRAHLLLNGDEVAAAAAELEGLGPIEADDLRARVLEARARLAQAEGDDTDALRQLDEGRRIARALGEPELVARLAARATDLALSLGAPHAAEASRAEALRLWDRAAATLPREERETFWTHPFRAGLPQSATAQTSPAQTSGPQTSGPETNGPETSTRVRRLLRVAARIAATLDPDDVLELAVDSAIELAGAERGFVLLRDPSGAPGVAVARNFDREDLSRASDKFSRTIATRVLTHGEPVLTSEAQHDDRFTAGTSVHAMQLRSVLSVPIRRRDTVLGALYVDNRFRRGRFTDEHVELLTGFADQVAVALTNARLHRELEERTEELAAERERIAVLLADKTAEVERLVHRSPQDAHGLVGRSAPMRELLASIRRLANAPVTVLVEGESGSGKELVARAIHRAGQRASEPFVSVNCGAIPEALLESELFGHVKGAFTGASRDRRGLFLEAGAGTLFLDEVGEMPMGMQVKLLRALQQREVRPVGAASPEPLRARVLAATNRTLRDEVTAGRFREDLYYRLAVVELRVPALRERREDIPELARALLERIAEEGGRPTRLTASAARALADHPWPGNVRQLENALRATAVFAESGRINLDALVLPHAAPRRQPSERDRIESALRQHGWNVARVGRELGIPRMTLYRRLAKYGLERPTS
ncbi:MAG: sigma 54-interacting transcriptional regulator [Sandaracinaceae bacterium]